MHLHVGEKVEERGRRMGEVGRRRGGSLGEGVGKIRQKYGQ